MPVYGKLVWRTLSLIAWLPPWRDPDDSNGDGGVLECKGKCGALWTYIKTSTASENQRFIPGGGHLLCIHPLSLCLCYTSPACEEAELSIFLEHASLP